MIAAISLAIAVYILPLVYFSRENDQASAFAWGMGGVFASLFVLVVAAKVFDL